MSSSFAGKAPKGYEAFSTLAPWQQQLLQQLQGGMFSHQSPLFGAGQNYLQNLLQGGEGAFSQFEAPYKREFNERTIPGLAERFAGAGAGAQSSSAFQQALGSAGAGLSENLAALRGNLQMQALPHALEYSQVPFNQARGLLDINSQGFAPKQQPFWQQLLKGLAPGVGAGVGMGLTGGASGLMGLLGGLFGGGGGSAGGGAGQSGGGGFWESLKNIIGRGKF